jgi:predicted transcriptional regulator
MVMKNNSRPLPKVIEDGKATKINTLGVARPKYYKRHHANAPISATAASNTMAITDLPTIQPLPNVTDYGSNFKWDDQKKTAAELIAEGHSQQEVADLIGTCRNTISNWLRVPEFCEKIDDYVMDTGLATKRIRIAKMKRIAAQLETVFFRKAEQLMIDPTDERLKDIAQELREYLKQIATEKEEYVELSKVQVAGEIGVTPAIVKVEQYLETLDEERRSAIEVEFSKVADSVIAEYTQGITTPVPKKEESDNE